MQAQQVVYQIVWMINRSVKRLKERGADTRKFLLYYDVDGDVQVNRQKQAYIERIGSECKAEEIPFFLEIPSYDEGIATTTQVLSSPK